MVPETGSGFDTGARVKAAISIAILLSLQFTASGAAAEDIRQGEETWLTPSPDVQLYIEGEDDRKGLGRLFIPSMTGGANEPLYAVYKDEELIDERAMGSSFFLHPGAYMVVLGTGAINQRITRLITVEMEETVYLYPDWCALTVEVLDKARNYYKQDLQIFNNETGESYGIIPAINPELGEHLQTLILPSGSYKIVRRGEDFTTYVNFTTVQLEPGTYTPYTVVIDEDSDDNFIGAGVLTSLSQTRQKRDWKLYGAIHGDVKLTAKNDASSEEIKTNLDLTGQFDNRLLYDKFPHYYLSNNLIELGILRQEGEKLQISQDRLRFKNTYVYYLLGWFGGYGRLEMTTHLFETKLRLADKRDVTFLNLADQTSKIERGVDEVRVEPVFFPFELKEGVGANLTPLKTFIARLNLRVGLGYWQTYNYDVYRQDKDLDTLFHRIPHAFLKGLETAIVSNLSLLTNLSVTTEVDMLFPFGEQNDMELDLENFISLRVTKNVAIEHTLLLKRSSEVDRTIQEQFISVRLSYFLF